MVWQRVTEGLWGPPTGETELLHCQQQLAASHKVIISGATGSGRLSLARELCRTLPHTMHEASRAVSSTRYFALGQLFPAAAISNSWSIGVMVQHLQEHLKSNGKVGHTVVLLSAQLSDQESLAVLALLAESTHLNLVLTTHRVATRRVAQLVRATTAIVEVKPLTNERAKALLTHRFAAAPHPHTVDFLLGRTNHNYRLLQGLADALDRSGALRTFDGVLTVFAGDVHTLDSEAVAWDDWWLIARDADREGRDLIDVLALAGSADLFEILEVFPPETIDAYLESGVLRLSEDRKLISLNSELRAELTAASLSVPRKYALYGKYSLRLHSTGPTMALRMAEWAISVNQPIGIDVRRIAATEANRRGKYDIAEQIADKGYSDPLLTLELIHALFKQGRYIDAAPHVAELDPSVLDQDSYWTYCHYAWMVSRVPGVTPIVVPAPGGVDYQEKLTVASLVARASALLGGGTPAMRVPLPPVEHLSDLNRLRVLVLGSRVARVSGDTVRALVQVERAMTISQKLDHLSALDLEGLYMAHFFALIDDMRYDDAERSLKRLIALTHSHERRWVRMDAYLSAILDFRRGRLSMALSSTNVYLASIDNAGQELRGQVEALRAVLLALCTDDLEAAEGFLSLAKEHPESGAASFDLARSGYVAVAEALLGRRAEAGQTLLDALDVAERLKVLSFQVELCVTLLVLGHWDQLPRLDHALNSEEARGAFRIWRQLSLALTGGDATSLDRIADELDKASNIYDANRVARISVKAIADFGLEATPAELTRLNRLRRAIHSREQHALDSRQILTERLTKREREVANLITQELTDPEIADSLGLSVRTVNAHVRSILAKLNIKSRRELLQYEVAAGAR